MSLLLTQFNYTDTGQVTRELDDVISISISKGSEIRNNQMTVIVKNDPIDVFSDGTLRHNWVDVDGNVIFKAVKAAAGTVIDEEIVEVFVTYTDTDPTLEVFDEEFLLFTGVINKGNIKYTQKEHPIELTCQDRTTIILDRLIISQPFKASDGAKSPTIQQNIIRHACEQNSGLQDAFDDFGVKSKFGKFLVDARLFSEGILNSGTVTSTSTRKLIETGQNFLTTVSKDDWVRNTITNEYAFIISVDSDTTLTLSKNIFTSLDTYQVSDGFIQDTRPDGTAYPDISFSDFNKPVTESIQTLSQIERTNSSTEFDSGLIIKRGLRWFIDKQNRFHSYVPSNVAEFVIVVGETSPQGDDPNSHLIHSEDLNNEIRDRINFIIYKAGIDMNGLQIKGFERAPFSGTPNVKDSFRPWETISRNMKVEDAQAGNITKIDNDNYNFPVGFPVTPAWDRNSVAVNNDSEYNINFVLEATRRASDRARRIFQGIANPRWAGNITLRGEDFQPGDLIDFTSNTHGLRNIKMRINNVTHSISGGLGWITSLQVEEDERELEV